MSIENRNPSQDILGKENEISTATL